MVENCLYGYNRFAPDKELEGAAWKEEIWK
jgi:hypothetical protein